VIRSFLVFNLLVLIKWISQVFFRFRGDWVDSRPHKRWGDIRLLVFLNHTSLYEPLFAGFAPYPLLWRFAFHGVLPVAEKTIKRRIGLFFRFMARNVVTVTRQRDETWDRLLNRIDRRGMVIILPEGRMMRRTGLDSAGREMTIRGGIADIMDVLDGGEILIVYSGGLHHIQAPGELLPRPFRNIRARLEFVDIVEYKRQHFRSGDFTEFKAAVVKDLTRRRNTRCPVLENGGVRGGEVPRWRGWGAE
jgi:hypothetical protein